ncbi:hypothetical protein [Nocardiopsis trehalosi]|jgi:clorobiocin biosynthesis protein CloN5|uniref:hypothetical protein n=1 Tax=Nocardiopsis trehalosi TaxID=109329 RepID=UPI000834590D|nr:hypothetical protein [Nocardiopsis trehalosi]
MLDTTQEKIEEDLLHFIRERFLDGDPQGELTVESPLREWGVLNSLNSAILLNHIHTGPAASVSMERIDARAFTSVRSIAAMLVAAAREGAE